LNQRHLSESQELWILARAAAAGVGWRRTHIILFSPFTDQYNSFPLSSSSSGTTRPVTESLGVGGRVVLDDNVDILEIDAARSDICAQ